MQCLLSVFIHHFIPSTYAFHIVNTQVLLTNELQILSSTVSISSVSSIFSANGLFTTSSIYLKLLLLHGFCLFTFLCISSFCMPLPCVQIVCLSFLLPKREGSCPIRSTLSESNDQASMGVFVHAACTDPVTYGY